VTFSQEWDQRFRANKNISIWPWSDLVSYVNRYARPAEGFRRVLEVGCGAGANIPFFMKLGVDYVAMEGSPSIVAQLHGIYPDMKERIVVGDFTQSIPFDGPFDLVVDRSAITHNATVAIHRTLAMLFDRLRSGGKLIGIDWFATSHPDANKGETIDQHTRTRIPAGQFAGVGAVHFSDQSHLVGLLLGTGFSIERLEYKQSTVIVPEAGGQLGVWNFVASKPLEHR
jgi:SAM-dependent methyltransferase